VIDVFAVQIHPYFTSKVSAGEAGSFAKQQLEQASAVCPEAAEKGAYITEIGWPKAGNPNGAAVPGVEEQKKAMKDILAKVGKESVLFSYQDDKWKNPGEYGVEQSFGCSEALSY
jgi:exo-beta-1,3-glucanase (GH17 family)